MTVVTIPATESNLSPTASQLGDHGELAEDESDRRSTETLQAVFPSETQTVAAPSSQKAVTDTSEEARRRKEEIKLAEARSLARRIGREIELVLTLLSFIAEGGPTPVAELLRQGPSDAIFRVLLDLYDVGFVARDQAVLSISSEGEAFLRKVGL